MQLKAKEPKIRVHLYLHRSSVEKLYRLSQDNNLSYGEVVEQLINLFSRGKKDA